MENKGYAKRGGERKILRIFFMDNLAIQEALRLFGSTALSACFDRFVVP
jgi:hypothetical protein